MAKKNDLELKFFYSSRFYEDDPLKPKNKEYFIKRDWKPRASLK